MIVDNVLWICWLLLWVFSIGNVINDVNAYADFTVVLHSMNFGLWTALMLIVICMKLREHSEFLKRNNVMFYICVAFLTVSAIVAFYSFMVGASIWSMILNCMTVGIWVALCVISYSRGDKDED